MSSLPPDTLLSTLPRGVWFSAVGEPLTASEADEAAGYVRSLRFDAIAVQCIQTWQEAKAIADRDNWLRDWWQTEHNEERRLLELLSERYGRDVVMQRMTQIMEGSTDLFLGPASVASARSGIADPALARSAAGAAAHSLHQFGLASLAGESGEHFFAIKFRLFLAGRWPLSLNEKSLTEKTFYIF